MKPPMDVDPEKFVIGHRGGGGDSAFAVVYYDDEVFRIDPRKLNGSQLLIPNVLVASVFLGAYLFVKDGPICQANPWLGLILSGVGAFTCVMFNAVLNHIYEVEQRHGPLFIYDKATGHVTLPREGVRFERSEIVHLQFITTKELGPSEEEIGLLSELNLITCSNGERKRWPVLRNGESFGRFSRLVKSFLEHTDLPVARVKGKWFGWDVTESMYDRPVGENHRMH